MKTPAGRIVYIDPIRLGYFHFRCDGLELVLQILEDGRSLIQSFGDNQEESPIFPSWKEAEKAAFELFDQTKEKQKFLQSAARDSKKHKKNKHNQIIVESNPTEA